MSTLSIMDSVYPLKEKIYSEIAALQIEAWISKEPLSYSNRKCGEYKRLSIGESWSSELFDCAWFRFSCSLPDELKNENLYALLDVNGEMLVVDSSGNPVEGLTNQCSTFDESLGQPGKISYELPDQQGNEVEIWADAGLNDLFGVIQDEGKIVRASLVIRNENRHRLWFDFSFLISLAETMDTDSKEYKLLESNLQKASEMLNSYTDKEIQKCSTLLESHIYSRKAGVENKSDLKISAIGHAHMDLAWLWPLRETIRKGARTFATALRSMERYPDYKFGASQPQLYDWIKSHYPDLYERVKEKIAEGRWEVQGGLWVECDLNLVSSESIIRQFLYGIRFYQKEFGIRVNSLMLPDAFGFSAALPQIMSLAGIDYFITMKPAWNLINKFPYHSFIWKGIDGSEIPAHILPEGTYNGRGTAASMKMVEENYHEKEISDHALILFGIGDGGGGPGLDHLESLKRIKECHNLPNVKQEGTDAFYSQWIKQSDSFPVWHDEIYLERHQGTFTSQAKIKKMNRKMEQALQKAELLSVVSFMLSGQEEPSSGREKLEKIWKETLLLQFHDILPGSSIKRVYDEAVPRYLENFAELDSFLVDKYRDVASCIDTSGMKTPVAYFNFSTSNRDHWLPGRKSWEKINLPPMGFNVHDADNTESDTLFSCEYENGRLENDVISITFSEEGWISSIIDKEGDEEILSPRGKGNLLSIYQDDGDCWDFPLDYRAKHIGTAKLESMTYEIAGPYAIARQAFSFGKSLIEQEIRLTSGSRRIDFVTNIDWRDEAKMLRTSFDVNIYSRTARYEIAGGFIERPTHSSTNWDKAKDEVPAHRWADLSQRDRGVALLNDCKYGYRIKGNTMDLDLLRSGELPRAFISSEGKQGKSRNYTDLEKHEFTYSLFPHKGDDLQNVIKEASFLNIPVESIAIEGNLNSVSSLKTGQSFFSTDNEALIIQSIKIAEDDNSVIIRLHESLGGAANCILSSFREPQSVHLCDLMEEAGDEISMVDGKIPLQLKPFQIVSLKLEY